MRFLQSFYDSPLSSRIVCGLLVAAAIFHFAGVQLPASPWPRLAGLLAELP